MEGGWGTSIAIAFAAAVLTATALPGQQQKNIPIRQTRILASTDSGVISNVYVVRVMPDGRPMVNDANKRRLLLIDTSMKTFKIIADTAGEAKNNFGNNLGGLLFYPSDSVAWVDRASQSLTIVDRDGNFGRTFSPPKASDMIYFQYSSAANYGLPGFDAKGRLYYRAGLPRSPAVFDPNTTDSVFIGPDSAPLVRADLESRRVDTIAYLKVPIDMSKRVTSEGGFSVYGMMNPMPSMDDWAYLSDGTVAIVRAQDYHIDWIAADGSRHSTPKMPFDWRRVTPEEKMRMVDSLQHYRDSLSAASLERARAANPGLRIASPPAALVVPPKYLPDYYPPLPVGSQVRVDLDGNLWIMPSTSIQAKDGLLYDVVNRNGEIVERVQLPGGRNLHGFAPGGIIYLSIPGNMNAKFGWARLEKAQVIRP